MDSSKFTPFNISDVDYKTVNGHPIKAYILTPKTATSPSKCPILVRFHGGFLITGAAAFPDWLAQWLVDYALQHSAILVMPDYRLMPEANGTEILEDVSDFWKWLRSDLQSHLAKTTKIKADLSKVLVSGESAGGHLSIQSGILQPSGSIQAVIAMYPVLDYDSKFFSTAYEKSVLGAPQIPKSILEGYLKAMKPGSIVSECNPPDGRQGLVMSFVQQGRFVEFLGKDDKVYPFRWMHKVDEVPPVLIIHGNDDSAVPVEGSIKFVEEASKKWGDGKVLLHLEPGEHGFDTALDYETPWLQDLLERQVTGAWLGN